MIKLINRLSASHFFKKHELIIGILAIIAAMCCLSLSGILVRLSTLGPAYTGFYRIFLALPILLIINFLFYSNKQTTEKNSTAKTNLWKWKLLAVLAGLIFGADLTIWNKSLEYTNVASSSLLGDMSPLFTIPLTAIIFKEKINKLFVLSVLISLLGLVILFKGSLHGGNNYYTYLGDAMAFFTAFTYAVFMIIISQSRKYINTVTATICSSCGALLSLITIALITEKHFLPSSFNELIVLILLGFLVQVCGQGGLIFGLKKVPVNIVAVLVLIEPLLATIIAYYLFNETLGAVELLGCLLIVIGIYLSNKIYFNKGNQTKPIKL